jgi:hypothetical protein
MARDMKSPPMTIRSTKELRDFLVQQMIGVASGTIDATQVRSITNLSQQVYNTLNIEAKMASVKAKIGDAEIKPVEFNDN